MKKKSLSSWEEKPSVQRFTSIDRNVVELDILLIPQVIQLLKSPVHRGGSGLSRIWGCSVQNWRSKLQGQLPSGDPVGATGGGAQGILSSPVAKEKFKATCEQARPEALRSTLAQSIAVQ